MQKSLVIKLVLLQFVILDIYFPRCKALKDFLRLLKRILESFIVWLPIIRQREISVIHFNSNIAFILRFTSVKDIRNYSVCYIWSCSDNNGNLPFCKRMNQACLCKLPWSVLIFSYPGRHMQHLFQQVMQIIPDS